MLVLHRAKLLASSQSVLALGVALHSAPAWMPGVYAQGLCKDAKPTKHTQPFTTGKGFGVRDREFSLLYKKQTFPQTEKTTIPQKESWFYSAEILFIMAVP